MSKPTTQPASNEITADKSSFWDAPLKCAAAGLAAAFLMSYIEWVDIQIRLTPELESIAERLLFTSYISLNLIVGLMAGFIIGLLAATARAVRQRVEPRSNKLISWVALASLGAIILNQHPRVHDLALGLLREAEKVPRLGRPIVILEPLLTYFVVAALLIAGSLLWIAVSKSGSWPRSRNIVILLALFLVISVAYYLDSRVEVQQYESTLHIMMFLVANAAAMAVFGIAYNNSAAMKTVFARRGSGRFFIIATAILLASLVALTFLKFDDNQNLKTHIFYRTTQAKQHFKLAQWALDFDRDGHSALLGGGDSDDRNANVHPAAIESIEDGIDNNCVGGDLTALALDEWQNQFRALHHAPYPHAKRLNVIYFFIDTVRADHLGAYGYSRNTSPNIDKLAARSTVFENAYSPSPYTYEAVPKFMQSAYWEGHFKTWTEALAENGYDTILFPRRLEMLQRYVKGIGRTIEEGKKGLEETIDAAISVLGKATAERPFCAYIYVADPHRPYKPHARFDFGSSSVDLYDGEIAYTDYHLGRLFDWMEQSGRINDTMVVIMSDHGESLGERGVHKHNSQVYDDQMRVPMIFYVPGVDARRVPDYVSTIDLGATILNLSGIQPQAQSAGVSLLPLMRGEPLAHPPIYGEHSTVNASPYLPTGESIGPEVKKYMVVTQDGYKLIYNRTYFTFELFNLKADPKELRNLYDLMPDKARELRGLLDRFVDVITANRPIDADEHKFYQGKGADDED
ncbi:MAG TPA: sulfatase-like hydrolase/transferase [Blastocatellia bacterium]